MTRLKGLVLIFDGKNKKQWGVTCNIGRPSHRQYMPIKPDENIETFVICGKRKIVENFTQHLFSDSWTWYFWTCYFQVGM
jgi:hypothetical protein